MQKNVLNMGILDFNTSTGIDENKKLQTELGWKYIYLLTHIFI
ncbi:hypothetical protein OCHUTO_1007 [Orientia chuto str. Dubai]|uniref:Uncharacterized protein n=1 Tax=Orientia chuto str. Dubai TaxID=1359168 RepID=A0A0F3MK78_9RICK|nr:hypothetical protein [Candidatus Orientia mediorientalis]KJV55009.1 hypothetical protein OCHUTO_1007 [Orientia chuto str. Dubai]